MSALKELSILLLTAACFGGMLYVVDRATEGYKLADKLTESITKYIEQQKQKEAEKCRQP